MNTIAVEQVAPAAAPVQPKSLASLLFSGSSALGTATLIERGLGFLANLAAARFGGAHVFGAYSLAMTTANNVASYAGAGIGTTANRFSGEYPYGSAGYRGLLRALAMVCVGSSLLAAAVLWFASGPLAVHLVHNPKLVGLLRLASLSAGVIILLECLRGLLIGQRRFAALLSLSVLFGGGMVLLLPWAARRGASQMVIVQAVVALAAIAICLALARKLKIMPPALTQEEHRDGPGPGAILRFGMVQLLGMVGLNAAGWWTSSMVARADISLVQAGWFSVAMQLRNMTAMPAGLISQTAYAQLTEAGGRGYGGADRVTVLSTFAATLISLLIAGPAVACTPWLVPMLYGNDFAGAALAGALAVGTGLIHMSSAPAAARLTVVSLASTGVINSLWSVLLIVLASGFITGASGAAAAAACFLVAHLFSAVAVLVVLAQRHAASRTLVLITLPSLAGAVMFAGLSWFRQQWHQPLMFSASVLVVTCALVLATLALGNRISPGISRRLWLRLGDSLDRLCGRLIKGVS